MYNYKKQIMKNIFRIEIGISRIKRDTDSITRELLTC